MQVRGGVCDYCWWRRESATRAITARFASTQTTRSVTTRRTAYRKACDSNMPCDCPYGCSNSSPNRGTECCLHTNDGNEERTTEMRSEASSPTRSKASRRRSSWFAQRQVLLLRLAPLAACVLLVAVTNAHTHTRTTFMGT